MIDSIDRIDLSNPEISCTRHNSPESIFNEFWNIEKDLSFGELLECEMGGITESGEEVTHTLAEGFEALKEQKFWAFSNTIKKEIHIWLAGELDADSLRIIIGHEIGHILEEERLSENPDVADEQRADNYGKTALLTERFIRQFKDFAVPETSFERHSSTALYDRKPSEMEDSYLVELAFQLYARSNSMNCTQALYERAQELKVEVLRRVERK